MSFSDLASLRDPPLDATICVCTYGDRSWMELAAWRAVPSAEQFDIPVLHVHGDSLHGARNEALAAVTTEWVVYLDADDELEPGFMQWMATGTADLRAPAVRYVRQDGGIAHARLPKVSGPEHLEHDCTGDCLPWGNWLVIGTAARAQILRDAGGWQDWPCYEDWDLWLRAWQRGASVEAIPRAIYRAHVRAESRNRAGSPEERHRVHQQIAEANGVPIP